jgi:putative ABC transport system ATP-binding protein
MTDSSSGIAIEAINLTMTYRVGRLAIQAVHDINLKVNRGEFVAVIGPSGCGKSTLLHMMGGLLRPSGGSILIDGIDISKLADSERTILRRKKIAYIFQRLNLLPALTVRENIELIKKIHGNGFGSIQGADRIINMLGLQEKMQFRPSELSGGEQQRVAIARAVIYRPSIILADEPTGSLDSRNSLAVLQILRNLNEKLCQTIVMITHNTEAASTAGRIIEMKDGQIINLGSEIKYIRHQGNAQSLFPSI